MRERTKSERGHVGVVLLLAVLVIVTMFAVTMATSSSTAAVTERSRYDLERAKANAKSGVVEGDVWLEGQIVPALKGLLEDASRLGWTFEQPHLVTLEFPTYEKRFAMTGTGATAEDFANVTATVTLAGPPVQRTAEGVTSSGAPVRVDSYRFDVRMVSEGHASGSAVARYEHAAQILVEIEVGPTS